MNAPYEVSAQRDLKSELMYLLSKVQRDLEDAGSGTGSKVRFRAVKSAAAVFFRIQGVLLNHTGGDAYAPQLNMRLLHSKCRGILHDIASVGNVFKHGAPLELDAVVVRFLCNLKEAFQLHKKYVHPRSLGPAAVFLEDLTRTEAFHVGFNTVMHRLKYLTRELKESLEVLTYRKLDESAVHEYQVAVARGMNYDYCEQIWEQVHPHQVWIDVREDYLAAYPAYKAAYSYGL